MPTNLGESTPEKRWGKEEGAALRERRWLLGPKWTRAYVAEQLHYGARHYAKIEQGKKNLTVRGRILLEQLFARGEKEMRARQRELQRKTLKKKEKP